MTERTCSVDGCQKPLFQRGWCSMHYTRMRRHGSLDDPRRRAAGPHPCRIDGCDGTTGVPGTARGLCGPHYQRWQRWGDPLYVPPLLNKGKTCSVEGCDRPCKSGGFCSAHDTRLRRHGSLDHPQAWALAPEGTKWCPQCWAYKPVAAFSPSRHTLSGLAAWCKRCVARRQARWRREYPDKAHEQAARRRKLLEGAITEPFSRMEIADRDGWKCQLCGKRIGRTYRFPHPRSFSIDHIVPVAKGGSHTRANVQAAHLECNNKKKTGGTDQLRLIG